MQIPILSWLDRPVKQAIWSVFDDVNKATEALDIFNKYKRSHFKRLSVSVRHIKILGMTQPIPLTEIYSPAIVSTTIFGRIYDQDWLSASVSGATTPPQRRRVGRLSRADEFMETHTCVVVLGSAGSGKTTLLRHLALSMCDKNVFEDTKRRRTGSSECNCAGRGTLIEGTVRGPLAEHVIRIRKEKDYFSGSYG